MTVRRLGLAAAAALALGLAAGLGWWFTVPHDAAAALAVAAALEARERREAPVEPAAVERVLAAWRRVHEEFEATPEQTIQARRRAADFLAGAGADPRGAVRGLDELAAASPDRPEAAEAEFRAAELCEDPLGDHPEALARYRRFAEGRATHDLAPEALLRAARILASGKVPGVVPAEVLEGYAQVVERHPHRLQAEAALWERGRLLEELGEEAAAIQEYQTLVERFPEGPHAAQAQRQVGDLYARRLNRPEEAARAYDRLEQAYGDTPAGAGAGARRDETRSEARRTEEDDYFKEHYGRPGADAAQVHARSRAPHEAFRDVLAQKLDVGRVDVELRIDPGGSTLEATARLRLTHGGEARRDLLLVLRGDLAVRKALADGVEVPYTQDRSANLLSLRLSEPLAAGRPLSLELVYGGKLEPGGGDLQWKLGDSGYLLGPGGWYPFGAYGDVFDSELAVTLPPGGFQVVGTGVPVEGGSAEAEAAGTTVRRRTDRPVFGLYLAYGRYRSFQGQWRGRPLAVHGEHLEEAQARSLLDLAGRVLDVYSGRFGDYPYAKLDLVEAPLPEAFGGVAPPSVVLLNASTLAGGQVPENLLAHELAHQWWGDLVPVSVAEGYSPWLSEGFATYSDALFLEETRGPERLRTHLTRFAHLYLGRVLECPAGDVAIQGCGPADPLYRAVVYEKGALVLHSLRGLLGSGRFFEALAAYGNRFADRPSTVADFRGICEELGGKDLGEFFEDWLAGPGFPHYAVVGVEREEVAREGLWGLSFAVEQRSRPFRTPVTVRVHAEGGGEGGESQDLLARFEGGRSRLEARLPFRAGRIEVDPDLWLLQNPGQDRVWTPELGEARGRARGGGRVGEPSPRFEGLDLDGRAWSQAALEGRVVLLNFWATWCPPCRRELPDLARLAQAEGPRGLAVLGVSGEPAETLRAFLARSPLPYPVVSDPDGAWSALFGGVEAVPTTFIIDATGVVRERLEGARDLESLRAAVAPHLGGATVPGGGGGEPAPRRAY
ncbi:MAG: redoxin domain-containing protein [Planctomycetes bacterium]|nr:redoxin domain-containing protein [Planctomycetota bacterium]